MPKKPVWAHSSSSHYMAGNRKQNMEEVRGNTENLWHGGKSEKDCGRTVNCMHEGFRVLIWHLWQNMVSLQYNTKTKGFMKSGHNAFYRWQPEDASLYQMHRAVTKTKPLPGAQTFTQSTVSYDFHVIRGCSMKHHLQIYHAKSVFYKAPTIRFCSRAVNGIVPAHKDIRTVSQGDGCHMGKDLHGQPT